MRIDGKGMMATSIMPLPGCATAVAGVLVTGVAGG